MNRDEAEKRSIIRIVSGSKLLGLDTPESDTDEMGVCIEPYSQACGLGKPWENFVSEGKGGDCTIYSLRKFVGLALGGNPNLLNLLYAPTASILRIDARGSQLQEKAPQIVSRRAGKAFLGYIQSQRSRLDGTKSSHGGHGPMRAALQAAHGFDTKYAMHMVRLAWQGWELLATGKLTLPIPDPMRSYLMSLRHGQITLVDALEMTAGLEADIKKEMDAPATAISGLPLEPDTAAIEQWMLRMYWFNWSAEMKVEDRAYVEQMFPASHIPTDLP